MINDKKRLITLLNVVLRNFVVTHSALKEFEKQKLSTTVTFDPGKEQISVPLKKLCTDAKTGKTIEQKEVFEQCKRSQGRALLAETFELIYKYCEITPQLSKFQGWKYYNFARIVRHCTSHGTGGRLNEWPSKLKRRGITSVSWKSKTICESMVGQLITMPVPKMLQLTFDEIDFVKKNLE